MSNKKPNKYSFDPDEYPKLGSNKKENNSKKDNDPKDNNENDKNTDDNNTDDDEYEADIEKECLPILDWLFTDKFLAILLKRSSKINNVGNHSQYNICIYGGILRCIVENSWLPLSEQQNKLIEYLENGGDIDIKTREILQVLGDLMQRDRLVGKEHTEPLLTEFNKKYGTNIKSYHHNNDSYLEMRNITLHAKLQITLQLTKTRSTEPISIETEIDVVEYDPNRKVLYDFDVNTLVYNVNARLLTRMQLANETNSITKQPITFRQIVANIRTKRYLQVGGIEYVRGYRYIKMLKRGYQIVDGQKYLFLYDTFKTYYESYGDTKKEMKPLIEKMFRDNSDKMSEMITIISDGIMRTESSKNAFQHLTYDSRKTREYKSLKIRAEKYYEYIKWITNYMIKAPNYIDFRQVLESLKVLKDIKFSMGPDNIYTLSCKYKDKIEMLVQLRDVTGFKPTSDLYNYIIFYGAKQDPYGINHDNDFKESKNQESMQLCNIFRYTFGARPLVKTAERYAHNYDTFMWFYNAIEPSEVYQIDWYKVMTVAMFNADQSLVEFMVRYHGITIPRFYRYNLEEKSRQHSKYKGVYEISRDTTFELFDLNPDMYYPTFIEYVYTSITKGESENNHDIFMDLVHETVDKYPFVPHLIQLIMDYLIKRGTKSMGMNMILIEWILDRHYRKAWDDQKKLVKEQQKKDPVNAKGYDYYNNEETPDLQDEEQMETFKNILDIISDTLHPLDGPFKPYSNDRYKYNKFLCVYMHKRFGNQRGIKTIQHIQGAEYRLNKVHEDKRQAFQSFHSLKDK